MTLEHRIRLFQGEDPIEQEEPASHPVLLLAVLLVVGWLMFGAAAYAAYRAVEAWMGA